MVTRAERIEGAMLGLLVGDALGVPYEFSPAHSIPPTSAIEMAPPASFVRAHAQVPIGTWSDDGAHALCLLASLLERGHLDIEDLGRKLVAWYRDGYMAVGGIVFDVGIQTERAIHRLIDGVPASEAGPSDERSNGNGSLMRVLPLALWHSGTEEELVRDAHAQSAVTHGHARARVCCALYCLWLRSILDDRERSWDDTIGALRGIYGQSAFRAELDAHVAFDESRAGAGTGYVVDTLWSARDAAQNGSYEAVVRAAIALGNDTDTTACVAGGIAGARWGAGAIPARWLADLRERDRVMALLAKLVRRDD